jgi:aarF domain-containing kinase
MYLYVYLHIYLGIYVFIIYIYIHIYMYSHLSSLLSRTPQSSFEAVSRVVKEELGADIKDLFLSFEENPLASASLAQVHIAISKDGLKRYAVKVQHEGLLDGATGDMATITFLIHLVHR